MPDLKGLQTGMVEWRVVIANMPWAVLLVYGGVQCMAAAFKVSGLAATISDLVLELQSADPTISQLILTLMASVLTEVMDDTGTCGILVPPSARLAEMSRVDPVYYALPVTIAASTSLMMPASNLAITVVISYADITVSDLLLPGLMIKCFTITAVLLAMNTIGQLVFHFSHFPEHLKALGRNGSTASGPTISNINTL
ncbi:solute carrier family 13 member 5-like [Ixodes scapularis]|uniref:solute carrier family 13 member 5-like n=1 Tax=Ixodes scapularis TaxID=6945 RepID=UPI001C38EEB8|nr:solute carrier family 13 member 5-like [Ixodes scapularis]